MVSNLQQSLSGLYEIAKSLNTKIKNLEDYTAFEIFVTDTEIPSGTLYKDLPEEIKMYVPSNYLNEALECRIPNDLTMTLRVRDDNPLSASNVIVDFGDGTTIPIQDSSVVAQANETYKFTHTYAQTGKYIVKILGDTYFNFKTWDGDSTPVDEHKPGIRGKVCRCLQEDLPIAECVTSLNETFNASPCLFNVNVSDTGKIYRKLRNITNFNMTFHASQNLLQVKGFGGSSGKFYSSYKPNWNRNLYCMFSGCFNLRTCDFRPLQSDNYTDMFANCRKLTTPLLQLLPYSFDAVKYGINIQSMFYKCFALPTPSESDKKKIAALLWEDPEENLKFEWVSGNPPFRECLNNILNFIPVSWGGTSTTAKTSTEIANDITQLVESI